MSEASQEDLWRRVYEGFAYQGDPTPQAGLNRVAAKCLKLTQQRSFDPSNCTVREQLVSPEELRQCERFHTRDRPRCEGGSIVILSYEGKTFVIDGHNRLSKWLNDGKIEPQSLIDLLGTILWWRLYARQMAIDSAFACFEANQFPGRKFHNEDLLEYLDHIRDDGAAPQHLRAVAAEIHRTILLLEQVGILVGNRAYAAYEAALDLYAPKLQASVRF